jgi:hypothetical protein
MIPVSGGMTERQVTLIRDLRPGIIMVTPSYMLALGRQGTPHRRPPPALTDPGPAPRCTSAATGQDDSTCEERRDGNGADP